MSLKFYTVDAHYINYLKTFDNKVPDTIYDRNNKFFCGIVININGFNYFAPISSFNKKQVTNLPIFDRTNKIISSIRFSFMIPVDMKYVQIKKISDTSDRKQRQLLSTELAFCRRNVDRINAAAERVYNYGINKNHPQYINCCKFKELEKAAKKYLI